MKTLKSLFLLCAGLSFCACSSDNEPQFPEGEGKVVVKIVSPTTRAISNATTGADNSDITITGAYTVTLTATSIEVNGENKTSHSVTIEANAATKEAVFTNVVGPSNVTVSLNEGVEQYNSAITTTIGDAAVQGVPAYGKTSTFTPETENGTVVYNATVKMAIPVARLEIGNISFTTTNSNFTKLNVIGVYLDNLRTNGGTYGFDADGNAQFASTESTTNYYFRTGTDPNWTNYGNEEGESPYILGNTEQTGDFFGQSAITALPSNSQVFAYNFYGAAPGTEYPTGENATYSCNPQFKICFSESQLKTEGASIPRYAMITTYKKDNSPIVLQNGNIYRVTSAALVDANIQDDEDGQVVTYQVEVTVEEAKWKIQDVTGEWK